MGLSDEERNSIVAYRIKRSKDTFAELPVLIDNKLWWNAANRLYYSCFYAASALLIKDGYQAHTHNGVKSILSLKYFKENKLDKSFIKVYGKLFNLRQRGDYEDWAIIEEEDIKPLLELAGNFIKAIENLI